jgi:hypothetical protein
MTKSELRNGMLVKHRDGVISMVVKDAKMIYGDVDFFVNLSDGCYIGIKDYNDNLEYGESKSPYDIMEVSECNYIGNVIRGIKKGGHFEGLNVLWTRSNPKVTEVESLIAKLQGQLEAAKGELEALR